MTCYKNAPVKGFLKTRGRDFVNGGGEKIALRGVGLGNWLLPEGYMWQFRTNRADRPRRIEAAIAELAGAEYARGFWKQFRENYITGTDIKAIADEGFNSVRVPINWRVLMEEGPGVRFKEDGFALIDRCLDLCEQYRLYAFLDLHGAPGGQTGSNIDDSTDDMPRLFMDRDSYDKGVALWVELAKRYKDREIVGGYDLLNEPIRTEKNGGNIDHYIGVLRRFYTDCIREIRRIDKNHLFSLEGHHWSTKTDIFDRLYDDNMCIHFHRYWNPPEPSLLAEYITAGERLNVPLWLGETGENTVEWFTAMFHILDQHGISWNFWTWKKMGTENSPYSINKPDGWGLITGYLNGGQHPGFEESQAVFDQYLHNMRTENCTYNPLVPRQILRKKGCRVPALAYDAMPGTGRSFSGIFDGENESPYRKGDRMRFIAKPDPDGEREDNPWQKYGLLLTEGEWADYTVNPGDEAVAVSALLRSLACGSAAGVSVGGASMGVISVPDGAEPVKTALCEISSGPSATVRVKVTRGAIALDTLFFE